MPIRRIPVRDHQASLPIPSSSFTPPTPTDSQGLYTAVLMGRQYTITSLDITNKTATVAQASHQDRVVYADALRQEYLLPAGEERDFKTVEGILGMYLRYGGNDIQVLHIAPTMEAIAPPSGAEDASRVTEHRRRPTQLVSYPTTPRVIPEPIPDHVTERRRRPTQLVPYPTTPRVMPEPVSEPEPVLVEPIVDSAPHPDGSSLPPLVIQDRRTWWRRTIDRINGIKRPGEPATPFSGAMADRMLTRAHNGAMQGKTLRIPKAITAAQIQSFVYRHGTFGRKLWEPSKPDSAKKPRTQPALLVIFDKTDIPQDRERASLQLSLMLSHFLKGEKLVIPAVSPDQLRTFIDKISSPEQLQILSENDDAKKEKVLAARKLLQAELDVSSQVEKRWKIWGKQREKRLDAWLNSRIPLAMLDEADARLADELTRPPRPPSPVSNQRADFILSQMLAQFIKGRLLVLPQVSADQLRAFIAKSTSPEQLRKLSKGDNARKEKVLSALETLKKEINTLSLAEKRWNAWVMHRAAEAAPGPDNASILSLSEWVTDTLGAPPSRITQDIVTRLDALWARVLKEKRQPTLEDLKDFTMAQVAQYAYFALKQIDHTARQNRMERRDALNGLLAITICANTLPVPPAPASPAPMSIHDYINPDSVRPKVGDKAPAKTATKQPDVRPKIRSRLPPRSEDTKALTPMIQRLNRQVDTILGHQQHPELPLNVRSSLNMLTWELLEQGRTLSPEDLENIAPMQVAQYARFMLDRLDNVANAAARDGVGERADVLRILSVLLGHIDATK